MLYNFFMALENKKILIVGNSAKEQALASVFARYEFVEKIYMAPGNAASQDFCELVDIRPDQPSELLNFVMENDIDMTICTNEKAIKADIVSLFQTNNQLIFGPSAESALPAISKSTGKRLFYRLRIPTPKFGIFEKQQMAVDYLKKSDYPVVIRTDESTEGADRQVCNTIQTASLFVEDLYVSGAEKIILEDFVQGHEFILYIITDGYHFLPLTSCANYKFMEDGNGGILTPGMGSYCPDYKLSYEMQDRILAEVAAPILENLASREIPYLGILGIEGVLTSPDSYTILELKPFLANHDCQAVLNLVNENLYTLFEACAVGSFADDYETLDISSNSSVSCVLSSGKIKDDVITGLDLADDIDINHFNTQRNKYFEYLTSGGRSLVLTKTSSTLSRARELLYENIDVINFRGKKYRKDICKSSD